MDFDKDGGNAVISSIQRNIQELNQQVINLEALLSSLNEERNRDQFNEVAQQAQRLSKEINTLMKNLVDISNNEKSLRIQRARLQEEYISVLNRLQACQRKAAKIEQSSMKRARDAVAQDEAAYRSIESDPIGGQQRAQVQKQQQIDMKELQERQLSLRQLEQDIGDVNQIFAELSRIVHSQGELVDSIEANVEQAQIRVTQGASNVEQAVYYNHKARQKKMLLVAFLTILIFIIGLTIYLAR
ncbi:unnamed protein product [Auanema sp. JU1783]|nr:unnamed protein product [Auanema sp. JU1783]